MARHFVRRQDDRVISAGQDVRATSSSCGASVAFGLMRDGRDRSRRSEAVKRYGPGDGNSPGRGAGAGGDRFASVARDRPQTRGGGDPAPVPVLRRDAPAVRPILPAMWASALILPEAKSEMERVVRSEWRSGVGSAGNPADRSSIGMISPLEMVRRNSRGPYVAL